MAKAYTRLARNDVSLITVAYVAVCPVDKTFDTQHSITAESLPDWKRLCARVRAEGGNLSAQLHHPGLFCMSRHGTPRGPSIGWLPSRFTRPKPMTVEDIEDVITKYGEAAHLCKEAGFAAIELHCGHGYLLSQFLTPFLNRRSDEYGGSVDKRATFPRRVLAAVKAAAPGLPVIVKLNLDDGVSFGLKQPASIRTAQLLAEDGADAIVPTFGYTSLNGLGMLRGNVPLDKLTEGFGAGQGSAWILKWFGKFLVPEVEYTSVFLRDGSRELMNTLRSSPRTSQCKVIYVGGADSLSTMEQLMEDGFDGVQMARPLLREPYFVRRLARKVRSRGDPSADKGGDVRSKCVRCNMCVLASTGPKFKPGCVFLRPGDKDIEEMQAKV